MSPSSFFSTTSFASGTTALDIREQMYDDVERTIAEDLIPIQPLDYVWLLLVTGDNEDPGNVPCNNSFDDNPCESATSSSRGFNLDAFIDIYATTTLRN